VFYYFHLPRLSFELFELKPLRGAIEKVEKKDFTYGGWFSAEYQSNMEKYIADKFGFRNFLIRFFNQIQFSFYKKASAKAVVVGKQNILYEIGYIYAYNGKNFIASPLVKSKARRIKALQDTLAKLNKSLIICLSPGKGTFYPEYFPSQYEANHTDSSNHKLFIKYLKKENVNYIDANSWFRRMKDTSKYKLYPKYGIHWSDYGGLLFGDSLISYIENLRNIKMNHIELYDFEVVEEYRYKDYDIGRGMNLLYQLEPEKMCYPKIRWIKDSTNVEPKTIVISDSFYWGLYDRGYSKNVFKNGEFWYYNRQIFSKEGKHLVKDRDLKEAINEAEVIVIMATEVNYHNIGWKFIENALKLYYDSSDEIFDYVYINDKLIRIMNRIKGSKQWYKQIQEKAEKQNITVDDMLLRDAYHVYLKKLRKKIEQN
jgi:hypothetical protein